MRASSPPCHFDDQPAAANAGPALCLLPLAVAPSALGPAAAAACLTGAVASAALCYAGFHPYVLVRRNAWCFLTHTFPYV